LAKVEVLAQEVGQVERGILVSKENFDVVQ